MSHPIPTFIRYVVSILLVGAASACVALDLVDPGSADLVSITIVPSAVSLHDGDSQQFTVYGTTVDGDSVDVTGVFSATGGVITSNGMYTADPNAAGSPNATWVSAPPACPRNSKSWRCRVVVTDTSGTLSDTATVDVEPNVASVTVAPSLDTIVVGETVTLVATAYDADGNVLDDRPITWATSDGAIASVNNTGDVQGLSQGDVTITADIEGQTATADIVVTPFVVGTGVASVEVSPDPAAVVEGFTVSLTATLRDGAGNVMTGPAITWSTDTPGVATVDNAGLVTGISAGSATITATSDGQSGTATVNVLVPGAFPMEYSLSRPLLLNNPGALLAGEDWQGLTTDQELWNRGFFHHEDATPVTGTRQVVLEVGEPTFGAVPKAFQTDASTLLPGATITPQNEVRATRSFTGVSRAWYRYTMRFQPGFTTAGPGPGANAWKWSFGGFHRHAEVTNTDEFQWQAARHGGTEQGIPGGTGWRFNIRPYWDSGEWLEIIAFEERIDATTYRIRYWFRILTEGLVVKGPPSTATWDKMQGWIYTGATVPAGASGKLQLGVNRNKPMFDGLNQWWYWGPWEVIDAAVIPDPYGIEHQMR